MKCDIKIMAIPERMEHVVSLSVKLGLTIRDIFVDYKHEKNPMKTSKGAFLLPVEQSQKPITHRCVIQDDIEVCKDFAVFVNYLAERFPDDIITLFNTSPKIADIPNGSIVTAGNGMWGVANIIPMKYLDSIFGEQELFCPSFRDDDRWYANWAKKHGVRILTTSPTSVNTIKGSPSSMGHPQICFSHNYEPESVMQYEWIDRTNINLHSVCGYYIDNYLNSEI